MVRGFYAREVGGFVTGDCRITIHVLHIENMKSEISL